MKISLPPNVYTPDQLRYSAEELYGRATDLRQRSHGAKVAERVLTPESQALLGCLPPADRTKPDSLEALAAELEALLAENAAVAITLAAPASRPLQQELVAWFRRNVKPNLLVSFHTNPDISGGMLVRTLNQVHDFSFRRLLLAEPDRFTRILQDVR